MFFPYKIFPKWPPTSNMDAIRLWVVFSNGRHFEFNIIKKNAFLLQELLANIINN